MSGIPTELHKGLKQRHLTMIAIGGVIGAGLFVGSGVVINKTGPGAFIGYALAGVLIVMVMRMLGEMATANPSTGSFAEYARKALGGWAGFSVGWLYWYFWVIVIGFEAVAGAKILTYWFDAPLWLLSLGLMILMTATNMVSVSSFGEFEFWFAGIKVFAICVFLGLGTLFIVGLWPDKGLDFSNLTAHGGFLPNGIGAIFGTIVVVIFSMVGPEITTIAAAESEHPEKAIVKATNSVMVRIAIFFVGSLFLLAVILPWDSTELGASPYVSAFKLMGIPYADHIMNAVVLTAVLSCLNSGLYTASRMLFVLAARKEAPARLVRVSGNGVPRAAILASTVVGYLCVIAAAVSPKTVFLLLLNSSGAIILFVYMLIGISQIVLRRRTAPGELLVKMWLFPYLSIATIAAIVGVLVQMYVDPEVRPQLVLSLLAWALVLVLYAVTRWRGGSVDLQPVKAADPVQPAEPVHVPEPVHMPEPVQVLEPARLAEPVQAEPSALAVRVLALANATVSADELLDELRRVAERKPAEYFVCVPANPVHSGQSESKSASAAQATTVAAAQRRLDYTLGVLRGEGIKAEGSLGDDRPMLALQTAVTDFRPDQLIVSTHPAEQSVWLTNRVVQKARAAHALPVTHVISHAKPTPQALMPEQAPAAEPAEVKVNVSETAVKVAVSDTAVKVTVSDTAAPEISDSAVEVTVSDTGAVEVIVAGTTVAETGGWHAHGQLRGISEIRTFFRTNQQPIYFFGPTAFNLLGIDRWVRNFQYVAYYDSWDGSHPHVFAPQNRPFVDFESSEQMNNYLLRDAEVQEHLRRRGGTPMIAMVFFDEETEEICRELGYTLILPPDSLRRHLDSKIVTTQLGNEAGAPSVPNVLARADSYDELVTLSTDNGLGTDLVVQTPYGDSGKTTFFIATEADWDKHADDIIGQEAKVMKRINNKAACVEACITQHGTIVGPFMTDLTGYPELTPYQGGWCGNDLFPEALTDAQRATAIEHVRRMGDRLSKEGYKGFFEVDVLIDTDTDEVYLGEINPRISGASSMTNVTAGAYADVPLFLFHLLEYMDVDYIVDVEEINARWRELAAVDVWSQLIMKEPNDSVERILAAPRTGTYELSEDGQLIFSRVSNDWHDVTHADEAFYMRVYAPGDYRFKGADLGILVTKGRMQTADGLTVRCQRYIDGIRAQYRSESLPEPPTLIPIAYVK